MCTSITYQMEDGSNALARTMDLGVELNPAIGIVPHRYLWKNVVTGSEHRVRHAFVGITNGEGLAFSDGVNEAGLACAVLYFPGYASYAPDRIEGLFDLAPHQMVTWVLSTFSSIAEVREALPDLNLVSSPVPGLGIVCPFHWIVTDRSGRSLTIEPTVDGIKVYDNPVGVMTNSPEFPWHLTNIRNYIEVNPHRAAPVELDGIPFAPFGEGSGSFGLPGDHTSPSRFIRVLFGKEASMPAGNETDALTTILHILGSVEVPKGSVIVNETLQDFTQYTSVMFCDSGSCYVRTYDNSQICKVELAKADLDASEIRTWTLPRTQQIRSLQDDEG
jgi:penicillin V amidase